MAAHGVRAIPISMFCCIFSAEKDGRVVDKNRHKWQFLAKLDYRLWVLTRLSSARLAMITATRSEFESRTSYLEPLDATSQEHFEKFQLLNCLSIKFD